MTTSDLKGSAADLLFDAVLDHGFQVWAAATCADASGRLNREMMSDSSATLREALDGVSGVSNNFSGLAGAVAELFATASEVTGQMDQTQQVIAEAEGTIQNAELGVKQLQTAADTISDVVKLINGIASRTNRLALNATIEAARAGDAGRGFAVVAGEVKSLADQTARAISSIREQIGAIQQSSNITATAMRKVSEVIGRANQNYTAVAGTVEQQSASTQEISRSVELVAETTQTITENLNEVCDFSDSVAEGVANALKDGMSVTEQATDLYVEFS